MKTYYLRLKDVDFSFTGGRWVSGVIDLYDNESTMSMATPSYVNYSTVTSSYGTNLLGDDTWTGFNIVDDSASPNIVTESGYIKDGRFVDTSGKINVTTWEVVYNNFSFSEVSASISFYYTDLSTLNFPEEWPKVGPLKNNKGIYIPNCPRYARFIVDFESEKDLTGISFDLYVKVRIEKPVISPLYGRTRGILRKFPEWMELRKDSEDSSTPSLATPTTVAGSFINAIAGEWLEDLVETVGYVQLQSFIETADTGQVAWVYVADGVPTLFARAIGDGTILSRAADVVEFTKAADDSDIFYWDEDKRIIYTRKLYQYFQIDDTKYEQNASQVWNWFDEHGLSLDLERHTSESNDSYKKRIIDVYRNKPGVGIEAFKLALRRELNLWLYEGATPDSNYLGATPEVLEVKDLFNDESFVFPNGMPKDKFIKLVDDLAVKYPTTWGYFRWDQAYWDIDGDDSLGYGLLPYQYDPGHLSNESTQSGVGDDLDLYLYKPKVNTGVKEFDLSVVAKGYTLTYVNDYAPINFLIDVYGRAEKSVYSTDKTEFPMNFVATMSDGKQYRANLDVNIDKAISNEDPGFLGASATVPLVEIDKLFPQINWYDDELQRYSNSYASSMQTKLADITGTYVFQMPRNSIFNSSNPKLQIGQSISLYSGSSYIFGTIKNISQSSSFYPDEIDLFDYLTVEDITYSGDITSSNWTIPWYIYLLNTDATPTFMLSNMKVGFGKYELIPNTIVQSHNSVKMFFENPNSYYVVFGLSAGSLNTATPSVTKDMDIVLHRLSAQIMGTVYHVDSDPDDSTYSGISSSQSINLTTLTVGASLTFAISSHVKFAVGNKIKVTHSSNSSNYFTATITQKLSGPSRLTVTVLSKSGSGTSIDSWSITPIWDEVISEAKSIAALSSYDEYIIVHLSSVSGDWMETDGWEIWSNGYFGFDNYPSENLTAYLSDDLYKATPSHYLEAQSATPGTYLNSDLKSFPSVVVGLEDYSIIENYPWESEAQSYYVTVNSGSSPSSQASWETIVPEVLWDPYVSATPTKEIFVELLTANEDGDFGAYSRDVLGNNIFIPKENIYVNGSNSWINKNTYDATPNLTEQRYVIVLDPSTETIEVTVSDDGLVNYPAQRLEYVGFEKTISSIESGFVDENGPWRNGVKPRPGQNNYGFTVLELDRDDFAIPNNSDSIVTWIGVKSSNDRVIVWLDQNTVKPAVEDDLVYTQEYQPNSIIETKDLSNLYSYGPIIVRAKLKQDVNSGWNPQIHSGWFYNRNDEYYLYVDPVTEIASPGSEGATLNNFYAQRVVRQGAPTIVKALSATPLEMRRVSFFDDSINLSLKNTQYVSGTGTSNLYLAYDDVYDATVSDFTSGATILTNGKTSTSELNIGLTTAVDHVYKVEYKLKNSYYVDNEYVDHSGEQRSKFVFDGTPSSATPFSLTYENSIFDPATPVDIALNPFDTTIEEGFVFLSLNEYDAATPQIRVSPGILIANGEDYAIVSIYSVDTYGNPKPNQTYTIETGFGIFEETNSSTATILTNQDGFAFLTLVSESGSLVESATVNVYASPTVGGNAIAQMPFGINARKVEEHKLYSTVDPDAIPADGVSATSVYGKVLDPSGNIVPYAYVSYRKGRSLSEIFSNTDATPDVGPGATPAATPVWPNVGRVISDASGIFRIGPFTASTPGEDGYWFVMTESFSSSPSSQWGTVGDVVFWQEYPPRFNAVNGDNQSIPVPSNLDVSQTLWVDDVGALRFEPLIPPAATVNAFPVTFDEETPTADATPVTNIWSPPLWYAVNRYDQYQRGILGDDFYVFKIENLPKTHPDYRDV